MVNLSTFSLNQLVNIEQKLAIQYNKLVALKYGATNLKIYKNKLTAVRAALTTKARANKRVALTKARANAAAALKKAREKAIVNKRQTRANAAAESNKARANAKKRKNQYRIYLKSLTKSELKIIEQQAIKIGNKQKIDNVQHQIYLHNLAKSIQNQQNQQNAAEKKLRRLRHELVVNLSKTPQK